MRQIGGASGAPGQPGRSISSVGLTGDHLTGTYSDGTAWDAGALPSSGGCSGDSATSPYFAEVAGPALTDGRAELAVGLAANVYISGQGMDLYRVVLEGLDEGKARTAARDGKLYAFVTVNSEVHALAPATYANGAVSATFATPFRLRYRGEGVTQYVGFSFQRQIGYTSYAWNGNYSYAGSGGVYQSPGNIFGQYTPTDPTREVYWNNSGSVAGGGNRVFAPAPVRNAGGLGPGPSPKRQAPRPCSRPSARPGAAQLG